MNWLFTSGGQSIGASASASVLPMNIQGWFPLRLTGLISLQSKGLSEAQFKIINSSALSLLYGPTLTSVHDYWKNHSFDYMDLCRQSDYLCSKQWKLLERNYSTLILNNTSDSISRRNVPWPHLSLIPDLFQIMRVMHTGSRPLWISVCVKLCNLNFWTSNIQSHFRIMKTVKLCQVEVH